MKLMTLVLPREGSLRRSPLDLSMVMSRSISKFFVDQNAYPLLPTIGGDVLFRSCSPELCEERMKMDGGPSKMPFPQRSKPVDTKICMS
jgi:hypothetical protein